MAQKRDWDPAVYYWLGCSLTQQAHPDEAVQALSRAVGLDPHDACCARRVGESAAFRPRRSSRNTCARCPSLELQQLAAQQPDNPEINYWLGANLSAERRDQEALAPLERSLYGQPQLGCRARRPMGWPWPVPVERGRRRPN